MFNTTAQYPYYVKICAQLAIYNIRNLIIRDNYVWLNVYTNATCDHQ